MAGGMVFKNQKNTKYNNLKGFTSEVLPNFPSNHVPKRKTDGVLTPGETISFNNESQNSKKELFVNFFKQEQEKVIYQRTAVENEIKELQKAIKDLIKTTKDLDREIENIAIEEIPEASEYQINFLTRIKNLIISFRKNISESSNWLECLDLKKKKKNCKSKKKNFWDQVNDNNGGAKYITSGEHSASRSAN